MAKVDMHVHSIYSEHPSQWFLNKIGAKESYTQPQFIYQKMKERGMDFVTITDHNCINGAIFLCEKYPDDCFISVESTTYFPEDGCKVHLLIYGIDPVQFEKIQQLRTNIYYLRDYLLTEDIAHSLAHATYSVNGKLTTEHLEKFILLFNTFEGINGARLEYFNNNWMHILNKLTPEHIEMLEKKYKIKAVGQEPWIKGFTGGSDDHGGIFLGKTYTETEARTVEEFLIAIKNKKTLADGRQSNYKGLVYSIYKIAYDYFQDMNFSTSKNLFFSLSDQIFLSGKKTLKERIFYFLNNKKKHRGRIKEILFEVINGLKEIQSRDIEEKLDFLYAKISLIVDEFFKRLALSFEKNIRRGDFTGFIKNLSSSLMGFFLTAPFISSIKHLYSNRKILEKLYKNFSIDFPEKTRKILWFTDTLNDLNGVSSTLKELAWISYKNNLPIKFVTALLEKEIDKSIPPNTILLKFFHYFPLPFYEHYTIKLPSLLDSLEKLIGENPTEVYISTPGPVGLIGIILGKLMNIKINSIYHSDFVKEASKIIDDEGIISLLVQYEKWFYNTSDVVRYQSEDYRKILIERGIIPDKLKFIPKGIDTEVFRYIPGIRNTFHRSFNIPEGFNLLYAGRISKDKNVDFLIDLHKKLSEKYQNVNLIFAGDGPYLKDLKQKSRYLDRVYFIGKIKRKKLPEVYSASDLFLFPSTTDTFGMVVLEAQACGVPVLVTDEGGPKNIILPDETGFILSINEPEAWISKIEEIISNSNYSEWNLRREKAIENVKKRFKWEVVIQSILM